MTLISTDSDKNTDSTRNIITSTQNISNTDATRSGQNKSDDVEQSKPAVQAKQPISSSKKASSLFDDDPLFGDSTPFLSAFTSASASASHLKTSTAKVESKATSGPGPSLPIPLALPLPSSSSISKAAIGGNNTQSSTHPSSSSSSTYSASHSIGPDPFSVPSTSPALSSFSSGFEKPLFSLSNKTTSVPFMTDPLSSGIKPTHLSHQHHQYPVSGTYTDPKTSFDPLLGRITDPLLGPKKDLLLGSKIPVGSVVAPGLSSVRDIGVNNQGAGFLFWASEGESSSGGVDRVMNKSVGKEKASVGLGGKLDNSVIKNSSLFGDDDDDMMGGKAKSASRTSKLRKSSGGLFDD
jgi:hypothetical protein